MRAALTFMLLALFVLRVLRLPIRPSAVSAKKAEQSAFIALKIGDYCTAGNLFLAAYLARGPNKESKIVDKFGERYRSNAILAFERAGDFIRAAALLEEGFSPITKKERTRLEQLSSNNDEKKIVCKAPTSDQRGQLSIMQHLMLRQRLTEHTQQALFRALPVRGQKKRTDRSLQYQSGGIRDSWSEKCAEHSIRLFRLSMSILCPHSAPVRRGYARRYP